MNISKNSNSFLRGWSHRIGRGDMSPLVLKLLAEKPMHGYEIIRRLEEKSHGLWRPSAGSIYPTLQLLEEQELAISSENAGKKIYTLTESGQKQLAETAHCFKSDYWEEHKAFRPQLGNVRLRIHELMKLIRHISQTGSEEQLSDTICILDSTIAELTKITK